MFNKLNKNLYEVMLNINIIFKFQIPNQSVRVRNFFHFLITKIQLDFNYYVKLVDKKYNSILI